MKTLRDTHFLNSDPQLKTEFLLYYFRCLFCAVLVAMTVKVFVDLVNGWGRAEVMNCVVAGFTVLIHFSLFRLLFFSKRQVLGFGLTAVFMSVTTAGMLIMAAHLMEFWEPFTDQITRTLYDSQIYLNLILALLAAACYKIAKQTKLN